MGRMYDKSATGNNIPEDTTKCIKEIYGSYGYDAWHSHQCPRPRGYGPDGLYCKRHAGMIADGRMRPEH